MGFEPTTLHDLPLRYWRLYVEQGSICGPKDRRLWGHHKLGEDQFLLLYQVAVLHTVLHSVAVLHSAGRA